MNNNGMQNYNNQMGMPGMDNNQLNNNIQNQNMMTGNYMPNNDINNVNDPNMQNQNYDQMNNNFNNQYQNNTNYYNDQGYIDIPEPSKKIPWKLLLIVLGVLVVAVIMILLITRGPEKQNNSTPSNIANDNKLICTSETAKITIYYNATTLTHQESEKMSYNFEDQKSYAELVGVNQYISEFQNMFKNNFNGECEIQTK